MNRSRATTDKLDLFYWYKIKIKHEFIILSRYKLGEENKSSDFFHCTAKSIKLLFSNSKES